MGWTSDRIDDLKRLWQSGLSASQCAVELGGITKNSVVAKLHRLGCSERPGGYKQPPKQSIPKKRQRNHAQTIQRVMEPVAPWPVPSITEQDVFGEHNKSLMELDNFSCRFPIGEPNSPDFYFCGKPEADLVANRPYCAAHARRAHNSQIPRVWHYGTRL